MAANLLSLFSNRPSCVFYSISAQEDNLGDIVIRLRMLDWIREAADCIVVYVGPMSEGYLQPFDLDERVIVVHSKAQATLKFLRALLRNRVFIVFPPGPSAFGGFRNSVSCLAIILASLVVSVGGGGVLQVGTSYRRVGIMGRKLHELKTFLFRICVLRDTKSFASNRAVNAPDLAFDDWGSHGTSTRFRLSVSLRSDYDLDEQMLFRYKSLAEDNGWRLTFVSQVRRDDERHRELAAQFDADLVAWEGSHSTQLGRVIIAYAESVAVLTDRLHSLIFSSNLEALPVALVHPGNDKLTSTFESVMDLPRVESGTGAISNSVVEAICSHSSNPEHRLHSLKEARGKLERVKQMVLDVLA